jgi:hypothetical protein
MAKKIIQLLAPTVEAYALHSTEEKDGKKFFTKKVLLWAIVEKDGEQKIEGYTTLGIDSSKAASEYSGFGGYQDRPE